MAEYMIVDTEQLNTDLTAVADAIRGKTGKTDSMTLEQMAVEIENIETRPEAATVEVVNSANGPVQLKYRQGTTEKKMALGSSEKITFSVNIGESFLVLYNSTQEIVYNPDYTIIVTPAYTVRGSGFAISVDDWVAYQMGMRSYIVNLYTIKVTGSTAKVEIK